MAKTGRILLCLLPLTLLPVIVLHDRIMPVLYQVGNASFCLFHKKTGYLCPGCGSTRAVLALLNGHPLLSLHENPLIVAGAVIAVLGYIELVCLNFGKQVRLLPRRYSVWCGLAGLYLVWALVRNFVPVLMPVT